MAIDPVSAARAYQQAAGASATGGASGGDSVDFGGLVQEAIRQAGQSASVAHTAQPGRLCYGTAIAAAETQLQTVIAVRDQVISAYQEILRMPI